MNALKNYSIINYNNGKMYVSYDEKECENLYKCECLFNVDSPIVNPFLLTKLL